MVGAGTVFTNDRYPRATTPDLRTLRPSEPDERTLPTRVGAGASLGAGLRDRLRPRDRPVRAGRHGLGGDPLGAPTFHLVVGQPARSVAVVSRVGRAAGPVLGCPPAGPRRGGVPDERPALLDPRRRGRRARPALVTPAGSDGQSASSWAVVGGGMLGLTLALRLPRPGQAGHGLRTGATASVGSRARGRSTRADGPITWDRHYHVTLLSDAALRAVLDELGLDAQMQWVETKTGYYSDGTLSSVSDTRRVPQAPRAADRVEAAPRPDDRSTARA